jgi:hypothetical protein
MIKAQYLALVLSKASGTLTLKAAPVVVVVVDIVGMGGGGMVVAIGGGKAARTFAGGGYGTSGDTDGGVIGLGDSVGLGATDGAGVV